MKFFKKSRVNEPLLAALTLLMLLVPAFAQQETDPTWYDPWAKPSPAIAAKTTLRKVRPTNSRLKSSQAPQARKQEIRALAPVAAVPVKNVALKP
jgi:hypothetical protein